MRGVIAFEMRKLNRRGSPCYMNKIEN